MTIQELSQKKWIFPPSNINLQTKIADSLRISPILSQLLINRGAACVESARTFLQSKLTSLSDPMLLPDMEKSSKRILEAISKGEKITVYGDYDVDGISATALMVQCLEILSQLYGNSKSEISYYIPDRLEEGYGLNAEAIEKLSKMGIKVIITVDCGINSFEEAKIAKKNGIDLIITDHHESLLNSKFESGGNDAFGVINPKLTTSAYPFRELSGVGVAFMLAWALGQSASNNKRVANEFKNFLMNATGLAALGTIADVVPLKRENRILAKYGLSSLQHSEHPGIKALKEIAGLKDKKVNSHHIGFCLGPRINAAGRVGNARIGVEMLTTKCEKRAKEIAVYLDNENKKRQKIQSDIIASAKKKILNNIDIDSELTIIISDDNWHPGVIGIVASRLAGEFYRPVIVIAIDDEMGHGSARSIPNFHIYDALTKCQQFFPDRKLLVSFGGHAQAAGLRILKNDISEFKKIFNSITLKQMKKEDLNPTLNIDSEIKLSSVSKPLLGELSRLAPHGEGNPIPVFAARDVKIVGQVRRFGVSGRHLSFYVRQGDISFRAVAFGMGDKIETLKKSNGNYSIAFVLRDSLPVRTAWPGGQEKMNKFQISSYDRGIYKENLELEVKDIST
jgi:single-stranded-DNA-specific exonuclease